MIQYYTKCTRKREVKTEEIIEKINALKKEICNLGDLRPGHLSIQYRKSGTKTIKEIGYTQLSYTFGGRSRTQYVRDADLPRIKREIEEHHRFKGLCDELIALSIELSNARTNARIEAEE